MKEKKISPSASMVCTAVFAVLFLLSACDGFFGGQQDLELIVGSGYRSSIQAAIDLASEGDTVIVLPGEYRESINFNGKNITLRSATREELDEMDFSYPDNPDDFDIIAETIINGDGAASVIALDSGEEREAEIKGLTIRGGGMGIYVRKGSQVKITDNIIENNSAGGIHLIAGSSNADASDTPSKAEIIGNTIRYNVRAVGAGIYLGYNSEAIIENNIITNNTATQTNAAYGGGAIGLYTFSTHNTSNEIKNNVIRDNTAYRVGGGIFLMGEGASTLITGNEISGNKADQDGQQSQASGGGIYIRSCQKATIYNNDFSSNYAHWRGGAMVILSNKTYGDDTALMTYGNYNSFNTFENNTAGTEGDDIYDNI